MQTCHLLSSKALRKSPIFIVASSGITKYSCPSFSLIAIPSAKPFGVSATVTSLSARCFLPTQRQMSSNLYKKLIEFYEWNEEKIKINWWRINFPYYELLQMFVCSKLIKINFNEFSIVINFSFWLLIFTSKSWHNVMWNLIKENLLLHESTREI